MSINIKDLNEGNAIAFKELYQQYAQKLFNYIFQKTGSAYYADEVVQVTFTKLWEKHACIKSEIPLPAQIFQIAKSSLIDILRKAERERLKLRLLEKSNLQQRYVLMNEDTFVPEVWHIAEKKMPPVRSRVFLLRVRDELSYKEISDKMNISVKTVGRHIELAFQQIRPLLPKL
ncbi:RNA polymerase sigma factor [Parafilimonas sp.]|uniref:RNA polymerase sigma factor n=1 Tax=Parafilimonas sp. TaxID=1969739 RepID=UPI0039E4D14E